MNSNLAEIMEDEFDIEVEVDEAALERSALTLADQARTLRITSPDTYAQAGTLAKTLKDMKTEIETFFAPMKKHAYDAWKVICNKETETLQPVKDADVLVRGAMTRYLDEQERLRKEEERKARIAAEEAARKEQERLLAAAHKAEERGKTEKAEELKEAAHEVYAAPVYVAPVVDKTVGGVTRKTDITVTVTDLLSLIKEVAAGRVPVTVLEVKAGPLKQWVKLNQITTCPGLHIAETSSVSVR